MLAVLTSQTLLAPPHAGLLHATDSVTEVGRSAGLPAEQLMSKWGADEAYKRHETGDLDFTGYCAHLSEKLGIRSRFQLLRILRKCWSCSWLMYCSPRLTT